MRASAKIPTEVQRHSRSRGSRRLRLQAPVVLIALWILLSAFAAAQSLTIYLHNAAGLDSRQIAGLTGTAAIVLRRAGIHVDWVRCGENLESSPRCEDPVADGEIIIRLISTRAQGPYHGALGTSIVGPDGGHVANVYVDSVRTSADEMIVPFDVLLGYTVAHEAGHCLLGPAHSMGGVMRRGWTDQDARQMRHLNLSFSKLEAGRAAARLPLRDSGATQAGSTPSAPSSPTVRSYH